MLRSVNISSLKILSTEIFSGSPVSHTNQHNILFLKYELGADYKTSRGGELILLIKIKQAPWRKPRNQAYFI